MFRPFLTLPRIDFTGPDLRFVDLTGDGRADLLISEDGSLYWHESLAQDGFGPRRCVRQQLDEEQGPRLVFSNSEYAVFLADMSGDGLSDLVRVCQGEVCYWPNLGYGRFGAKVTMDSAPRLGATETKNGAPGAGVGFDPRRVRLADIDGSGTSDLVYFGEDGVLSAFNQCGESWRPARLLRGLPPLDRLSSATVTDLLGSGTAFLVWSSPLPGDVCHPMRYVNLMSAPDAGPEHERPVKPHLLVGIDNNLGSETLIDYAPSTRFYLADRLAGLPWATRLPFPVHVVERVTTIDYVSRNRFITLYAYRRGHYDAVEREFRGFGMVEQWDSQAFGAMDPAGTPPAATPVNEDPVHSVPQVLTRTWYHTGQYDQGGPVSVRFRAEYYREGDASAGLAGLDDEAFDALLLADTVLPDTVLKADGSRVPYALTEDEAREACRALRGSILRQEIYGLDNSDASDRPYTVSERNYTVELLHPKNAGAMNAVFLVHPRQTIDLNYERNLYQVVADRIIASDAPPTPEAVTAADPRVSHSLVLDIDAFGNVLRSVSIGYGRRFRDPDLDPEDQNRQHRTLATLTRNGFTNPATAPDAWCAPLPCEEAAWELVNPMPPGAGRLMSFAQVAQRVAVSEATSELPFEEVLGEGAEPNEASDGRLRSNASFIDPTTWAPPPARRERYWGSACSNPLACPARAIVLPLRQNCWLRRSSGEGTPLLSDPVAVLGSRAGDGGGYVDLDGDGHWWTPSGRLFHHSDPVATSTLEWAQARAAFFLPRRLESPFGPTNQVAWDEPHNLAVVASVDALGNRTAAAYDYRVLQALSITDPNGNQSVAAYDVLGLVCGIALQGKAGEAVGDSFDDFAPDPPSAEVSAFFNAPDPRELAVAFLGSATSRMLYDVDRFRFSRAASPQDPTRWKPVAAAAIVRETHSSEPAPGGGLKLQVTLSFSDGLAREVRRRSRPQMALSSKAVRRFRVGPPPVGPYLTTRASPYSSSSRSSPAMLDLSSPSRAASAR